MTEQEIIQQSYEQSIRDLYRTFFTAFTAALGDEEQENQAGERFQAGVDHAKHVRNLALSLIAEV